MSVLTMPWISCGDPLDPPPSTLATGLGTTSSVRSKSAAPFYNFTLVKRISTYTRERRKMLYTTGLRPRRHFVGGFRRSISSK